MRKLPAFILFACIVFSLVRCASDHKKTSSAETGLWHDRERSIRYRPDGEDFIITNGDRRFNRAIYGTNTGFRVEAGDLPEFGLYMPGMGGNLRFGFLKADTGKWMIDAATIEARYRPGSMMYTITDPFLGEEELSMTILAMDDAEGFFVKIGKGRLPENVDLIWAFGGASGERFSRSGDVGADPESSFYLKPENCTTNEFDLSVRGRFMLYYGEGRVKTFDERYENNNSPATGEAGNAQIKYKKQLTGLLPAGSEIHVADASQQGSPLVYYSSQSSDTPALTGKIDINADEEIYIAIVNPETKEELNYRDIPALYRQAEKSRKELASRIKVTTPDPYINTLGGAISIAADAVWEHPAYLHGAIAWRTHLPGWRGAYTGDFLGWHDRARTHFRAYAKSQYLSPASGPHAPDPATHLARQKEERGTSVFTRGYISRRPGREVPPSHYDMNLVYIDELLWHFYWTGDWDFVKEMWPVIERHFEWEKRNFDGNDDGLYDAYASIWASDAIQYSGGGVTHSSSYNYRANKIAAMLAESIGKDAEPYQKEAEKILRAINEELWMPSKGWYAEYKDLLGLKRVHPQAALWTVYQAIDSDVPDPFQAYQALRYVDTEIPRIPVIAEGMPEGDHYMFSTSNWMPYTWSVNNVSLSENLHTALAYWKGGRPEEAFRLWRSLFLESMYLGLSPGSFQQLSFYDAFRGELYRDFSDPVGLASRTLVEGLFGIIPNAPDTHLIIQPGLPVAWEYADLKTPDVDFSFQREGDTDRYIIIPSFPKEMDLTFRVRAFRGKVRSIIVNGNNVSWTNTDPAIGDPVVEFDVKYTPEYHISIKWTGERPEDIVFPAYVAQGDPVKLEAGKARITDLYDPQGVLAESRFTSKQVTGRVKGEAGHRTFFIEMNQQGLEWWEPVCTEVRPPVEIVADKKQQKNSLIFRIRNNTPEELLATIKVNPGITDYINTITISPGSVTEDIIVPKDHIKYGSNVVVFNSDDHFLKDHVINWQIEPNDGIKWEKVELTSYFNDSVSGIFREQYYSPRSPYPTLQLPVQGFGDWCTYAEQPVIDDSGLRKAAGEENTCRLPNGIPFFTPGSKSTDNILFTSRWDNYPEEEKIGLSGRASHLYLLMAGSAHHMQSRFVNGEVVVHYTGGTEEKLQLVNPETWWPIEQDYYEDGFAFKVDAPRPPRVYLKTGELVMEPYDVLAVNRTNLIDGGAATVMDIPLDPEKELESLILRTLANDVVIGLMAATLERGGNGNP